MPALIVADTGKTLSLSPATPAAVAPAFGEPIMRHLFAVTAAALLWSAATAFAADPVGRYSVEGTNPGGGSKYAGTVCGRKTGETYRVIWVVGGTRYVGTGIGDKDFIAVSYNSGSDTGLALYGAYRDNWSGRAGPMPAAARSAPKSGSANSRSNRPRRTSTPTAA